MFEVKIAGYYKGKTPKRKRLRQSFSNDFQWEKAYNQQAIQNNLKTNRTLGRHYDHQRHQFQRSLSTTSKIL